MDLGKPTESLRLVGGVDFDPTGTRSLVSQSRTLAKSLCRRIRVLAVAMVKSTKECRF